MKPLSVSMMVGVVALATGAVAQGPVGLADPMPVIDGFAATCQRAFPNEGQVSDLARAAGFIERRVTIPADSSVPAGSPLPRFFQRGEAMLTFARLSAANNHAPTCQVVAMAQGKPDAAAFAALVASRLTLGAPRWSVDKEPNATFTLPGGMEVRAAILRYRNVRSYSLQMMRTQGTPS